MLWISAAAALVYLFGFLIAAALFLLLYLRAESSLGWRRSLLVSVGTVAMIYVVFNVLARMRFPVGVVF
jgi:hypothetical protein